VIGRCTGRVTGLESHRASAAVHGARAGDRAWIVRGDGRHVPAVVAAIAGTRTLLTPAETLDGIALGDAVVLDPRAAHVALGTALLGRALGAGATPLDGGPPPHGRRGALAAEIARPHERVPLAEPFWTGVRAIDGPLALGRGARIGIFGAPGAGKSTLLEGIVAGSQADASVVALIGERGREAERWLHRIDARTTVVCATGDRGAPERLAAADFAFAHAGALRARGLHVLLVLDSLARVAAAARDVALAQGRSRRPGGLPAVGHGASGAAARTGRRVRDGQRHPGRDRSGRRRARARSDRRSGAGGTRRPRRPQPAPGRRRLVPRHRPAGQREPDAGRRGRPRSPSLGRPPAGRRRGARCRARRASVGARSRRRRSRAGARDRGRAGDRGVPPAGVRGRRANRHAHADEPDRR
jgi:hypothetical protein